MAKRNKSALKAHRQNIKRREANRQLRSKLRTGLKALRKTVDGTDKAAAAEARRRGPVARRQDGLQGHHPPQHRRPLQVPPVGPGLPLEFSDASANQSAAALRLSLHR